MSVLSVEGPRCDSTEWVWGIFLAVGIANSIMAVEAPQRGLCLLPSVLEGGFGDRNLMEPQCFETTLKYRSAELGVRDAACNPRQFCLSGCLLLLGLQEG